MADADYTAVPGLSGIPCMVSVNRLKPDIAAVVRTEDRFDTLRERHILLDGYFSVTTILQRDLAAVTTLSDGNTVLYEIMSTEPDSQENMTRLAARLYQI